MEINKNINSFLKVVGLIVIFVMLFVTIKQNEQLEVFGRYTIGKVKNIYPIVGDFNIDYTFKVNYIEFEGTNSADKNDLNRIGEFFIVKFLPNNPKFSKILLDYPVLDTLITPPSSGWESLPARRREKQ